MVNLKSHLSYSIVEEEDYFHKLSIKIQQIYPSFVKILPLNGGYFQNNRIHFYGVSQKHYYHDLIYMNSFLKSLYGNLLGINIFIGEDIFGNLFSVSKDEEYFIFDIETSESTYIINGFENFINEILINDSEYYNGYSLIQDNAELINQLRFGKRLRPKLPFILGGEYTNDNLVLQDTEKYLKFCSDIAKQIVELPDGANFTIELI